MRAGTDRFGRKNVRRVACPPPLEARSAVERLEERTFLSSVPTPWVDADINTTGGSASYAGTTFTETGKGTDIGGPSDQFNFCYQPLVGDGIIVARVASETNPDVRAKAGVMIRDSLSTDAKFVDVVILPGPAGTSFGAAFGRRTAIGGNYGSTAAPGVAAPQWVRLVRAGDSFTGSISQDGSSWTAIGSVTIPMTADSKQYIGLCTTSHTISASEVATLDSVSVAPTTPTGLTAVATSATSVHLSWNDVLGETNYTLQRAVNGGSFSPLATLAANATSYVDTPAADGTNFAYRLTATNAEGASGYAAASATTPLPPPTQVTTASPRSTEIDLQWTDNSVDETSFAIERSIDGTTFAQVGSTTTNSFADNALSTGTTYEYRVRAANAQTSGDAGLSAVVQQVTRPSTPTGVAASNQTTTGLTLQWSDVNGETGYSIYRSTDGTNFAGIGSTSANVVQFIDTGLATGVTYYYKVTAFDAAGEGGAGTLTTATLPATPAVTAANSSSHPTSEIDVTWSAVSGATTYTLERQDPSTGIWSALSNVLSATSFNDTGLPDGASYAYRVTAVNAFGGASAASAAVTAATKLNSPGSSLTSTLGETSPNATSSTPLQATLDWVDNTSDEAGYVVERSQNGGAYLPIATLAAGQHHYVDSTLTPYLTQQYRVHAFNAVAVSSDSVAPRIDRLAPITAEVNNSIAAMDIELAKTGDQQVQQTFTVRNLARSALEILVIDSSPSQVARATVYLNRLFQLQNADGSFPWNIGPPGTKINIDPSHSACFIATYLGSVLERYGPLFSQSSLGAWHSNVANLTSFLATFNPNTPNKDGSANYTTTNIWLQNATSLLTLGEALGRKDLFNDSTAAATATSTGVTRMNGWLSWTKAHGIAEYDSPIYYAVDLNALSLAYNALSNTTDQALLKTTLDYFADDIAANYFDGQQTIAGAHSRDEDFLFGTGGLDYWTSVEGIRSTTPVATASTTFSDGEGAFINAHILTDASHPIWHFNASAVSIARTPTKVARQAWNSQIGRDKYTYVTPTFAIGSSSGYTDAQDKQVQVQFAQTGAAPQPSMSVILDEFDHPYGQKVLTGTFSKPEHLQDNASIVQDHGNILALFDLAPEFKANPSHSYSSVAENIILPINADEYYVNGTGYTGPDAFNAARAALGTFSASSTLVLGVRMGNTIVAYRPFLTTAIGGGYNNGGAVIMLSNDDKNADGTLSTDNAGRLTIYSYQGAARTFSTADLCHFGLMISAATLSGLPAIDTFLSNLKSANLNVKTGSTWGATFPSNINQSNVSLFAQMTSGSLAVGDRLVGGSAYYTTTTYNNTTYDANRFTFFDGTNSQDIADKLLDSIQGSFA